MGYKNSENETHEYSCEPCDYTTQYKSDYKKHTMTAKHKETIGRMTILDGKSILLPKQHKCSCGIVYKHRQGLHNHKKKCNHDAAGSYTKPLENTIVFSTAPTKVYEPVESVELTCQPCNDTDNNMFIPKGFILQLFKENQQILKDNNEFKSLMAQQRDMLKNLLVENKQENTELVNKIVEKQEVDRQENKDLINKIFEMTQQQLTVTNNNITNLNTINNNNQRFNLNVFLNETCKDAMNLDEFLDTIRPTFDELLVMGDVGFVSGISDIFIKRLRALDITKRPIHCTDAKRETIFLKENNVWTKDDNGHSRLNSIIEKVEYRNVVCLHQWCLDNPDAMVNNHEKNLLRDKIYLQTLLGDPKTREKVVRNIAKEVALDREAIMLQFGRK